MKKPKETERSHKIRLPLKVKLRLSVQSVGRFLRRPTYIILSLLIAVLMSALILWWLNIDLLGHILTHPGLNFIAKLRFIFYMYDSLFRYASSWLSIGIILTSLLAGINTALLIYVWRHRRQLRLGALGVATTAALLSTGCVGCGTSLFAPIIASSGAAAGVLTQHIGTVFLFLSAFLFVYSIYKLGLLAATIHALENQQAPESPPPFAPDETRPTTSESSATKKTGRRGSRQQHAASTRHRSNE